MLCGAQRREDTAYSHTQNPSSVNCKCKLEATALNTGTHVVPAFISGLTTFRVKHPTTYSLCDSCPSPLIPPSLSHFHCPSKNRLPKHLLKSTLKSTYLPIVVGWRDRKEILNNTKRQWKILTCTYTTSLYLSIPSVSFLWHFWLWT